MPLGVFLAVVLLLLGMSGVALHAGLRARRRAALVRSMPTTPIGAATDGYRELQGTVEAVGGTPLQAPLTQWPCCWYRAKVERYVTRRTGDARHGRWETAQDWTSGAPFLVRDATGLCIVDPHRAEVTPTDRSVWYGRSEKPKDRNPPRLGPTAPTHGLLEVPGNARYRYSEERIYAGDPLLVLGELSAPRPAADDDPGGDCDGAGQGVAGNAELERDDALFAEARRVTRTVIARGSGARPFLLTTTPQDQHVAQSASGGSAALGIALVLLAVALALIWARFG